MKVWMSREDVMFLFVSRNRTSWMQKFEVPDEVAEEYFRAEEQFNKAEEKLLEQIPEEHRDSL